jgi:predicted RNA-binding protein with TRAM domain
MSKRFPEKTCVDTQECRRDEIARIKGFLIFVPLTKIGEHLKVKISQVKRKFVIAEKLSEIGEEKNN